MKSNKTAKIPNGVSVIIGFAEEDLSGLEWNIGEWSEGDMYIYLSDKGSKDFVKRLGEAKNFFLFIRDSWGDYYDFDDDDEIVWIKPGYYDKDNDVYYSFDNDMHRRNGEPEGNISLNIDPEFNFNWNEEGVENGYDLILKQYLGLDKRFINWDKLPWVK